MEDRTFINVIAATIATIGFVVGVMTHKKIDSIDNIFFGVRMPEMFCTIQVYTLAWAVTIFTGKFIMIIAMKILGVIK